MRLTFPCKSKSGQENGFAASRQALSYRPLPCPKGKSAGVKIVSINRKPRSFLLNKKAPGPQPAFFYGNPMEKRWIFLWKNQKKPAEKTWGPEETAHIVRLCRGLWKNFFHHGFFQNDFSIQKPLIYKGAAHFMEKWIFF